MAAPMQPEKPNILFIINPNAGKRRVRRLLKKFSAYQSKIIIRQTEYPQHCQQIIREELDQYDVFVAVGGDGTVNEAASALAGSKKKLAVFPAGSGNGFAREFGFNQDIDNLIQLIEKRQTIASDVLLVNKKISVHVSGVGYDGAVAHDFTQLKGRGFWNYFLSTMRVIVNYKPIEASIQFEGRSIKGKFFMIDIANSAQFGYGARLAPKANPTDGYFDLVLVKPLTWLEFPFFSLKLFLGKLKPGKKIQYFTCQSPVTITTSEKKYHIDGEAVELPQQVEVEIRQGVLNVIDTGKRKFS